MGIYVSNIATPHRTLTERERRQLLKVTGERRDGYRDHILYSMALATGLREHELASLEVGDVFEVRIRSGRSYQPSTWRHGLPACPRMIKSCCPCAWLVTG